MNVCKYCGEEIDSMFHKCQPSQLMTKTTGQRIVEEWLKPPQPIFSSGGKYDDTPLSDLAERIDNEIISCGKLVMESAESALETANAEVERLRERLEVILAHPEGVAYSSDFWKAFAREALAKKETP